MDKSFEKYSTEFSKLKCPNCGAFPDYFDYSKTLRIWHCPCCDSYINSSDLLEATVRATTTEPCQCCDHETETDAIEACPYCGHENVYPNWNTGKQGYIAKCQECGKTIMLCDECQHADDNFDGSLKCDWHTEVVGKYAISCCFRGVSSKTKLPIL